MKIPSGATVRGEGVGGVAGGGKLSFSVTDKSKLTKVILVLEKGFEEIQ